MATTADEIEMGVEEELAQVEYLLGQIGSSVNEFGASEESPNRIDLAALTVIHQLLNQALNLADALT